MVKIETSEFSFKDEDFRVASQCRQPYFCVSVAVNANGAAVRDTKDSSKTTLSFNTEEWREFVKAVKNGEFDL